MANNLLLPSSNRGFGVSSRALPSGTRSSASNRTVPTLAANRPPPEDNPNPTMASLLSELAESKRVIYSIVHLKSQSTEIKQTVNAEVQNIERIIESIEKLNSSLCDTEQTEEVTSLRSRVKQLEADLSSSQRDLIKAKEDMSKSQHQLTDIHCPTPERIALKSEIESLKWQVNRLERELAEAQRQTTSSAPNQAQRSNRTSQRSQPQSNATRTRDTQQRQQLSDQLSHPPTRSSTQRQPAGRVTSNSVIFATQHQQQSLDDNHNRRYPTGESASPAIIDGLLPGRQLPSDGSCVIISHVDPSTTSDQLISIFQQRFNPRVTRVRINRLARLSSARIAVLCQDPTNAKRLVESIDDVDGCDDMTCTLATKKRPILRLHGIPNTTTTDDLIQQLKFHNDELNNVTLDDSNFTLLFKRYSDDRNKTSDFFYRCSPDIHKLLINLNFVRIDYQRCKTSSYSNFLQCWKCQMFGHTSSSCKQETQCGHCSGAHLSKTCTQKSNPTCINCTKYNQRVRNPHLKLDTCHSAMTAQCPVFKRMRDISNELTDFDRS